MINKEEIRERVHSILNQNQEYLVSSLTNLIRIKSIQGDPKPGAPFGIGPAESLDAFLSLGKELGFQTCNIDSYAGHILWNPTNPDAGCDDIGVLVHLDVVPADEDSWIYPPYSGQVVEGRIYGRGAQDDKGPAIAVLFALMALKESGYVPRRSIRLIAGTNEETGSADLPKYLEKYPEPAQSIVPDGYFPVVHGEMGIQDITLTYPLPAENPGEPVVRELSGGSYRNMVPDSCRIILSHVSQSLEELRAFIPLDLAHLSKMTKNALDLVIETQGKSVHAALPELGTNAISIMMKLLSVLPLRTNLSSFIDFYNTNFGSDCYGERIGCSCSDEESGSLRLNTGVLTLKGNQIVLDLNLRYPVSVEGEWVYKAIQTAVKKYGVESELLIDSKPLYFSSDDPFIKMLHKEYLLETGDHDSVPLVQGGGTYARTLKNAAAIGGKFPYNEDRAHQTDENIFIKDLLSSARIYAGILIEMTS